jgi:predicted MFS family arabinose efflux permease
VKADSNYRWLILVLIALTCSAVITVPGAGMAVLFEEIAGDLHLDLVQVGLVWGIGALLGMVTGSITGAVIDRFGPRRVILMGVLLVSLGNALRGLAGNFAALMAATLALGGLCSLVAGSGFKLCSTWFPRRQLGVAYGTMATGLALGLLIGSMFSATVLSPWLGNWRRVLFFYGAIGLLFLVPWLFLHPDRKNTADGETAAEVPIRRALSRIVRSRELWLLGLVFLGIGGCQQGIAGYLALYLRGLGWSGMEADAAVSLVYAANLVCILPMAYLSDRLGLRKPILSAALLVMFLGSGLLAFTAGAGIWAAVVLLGMVRDGPGSLVLTMAVESEGVGPAYAATAGGFVMAFFYLGSMVSPPIGNKLAEAGSGVPFAFWTALVAIAIVCLWMVHRPRTADVLPQPLIETSDG